MVFVVVNHGWLMMVVAEWLMMMLWLMMIVDDYCWLVMVVHG